MLRRLDLGDFKSTYLSLVTLLSRLRQSSHTQIAFATPPGQTTVPQDPTRSGGSTSSSSSTESKPEPYAQNVATDFLKDTYATVVEWMGGIEWINPDAKVQLSPQYRLLYRFCLTIVALSNKRKCVSARSRWLNPLMTAAFPCIFDAIHHQLNNPDGSCYLSK